MMTEQELDRLERDAWLLLRDLERDRVHSRRLDKRIKILLKKQKRNAELFAQSLAESDRCMAEMRARHDRSELTYQDLRFTSSEKDSENDPQEKS